MHFWKLIPAQILCRVRKSPYVRHPVCQMVSDVALAIVRYAINLGPVGCTLNVDGLPLSLFYAPLFSKWSTHVWCLWPVVTDFSASSTLKIIWDVSHWYCLTCCQTFLCSISCTESTTSTFSAPQESLKTDVKHLHAVLECPMQTFSESPEANLFVFCVFQASWKG